MAESKIPMKPMYGWEVHHLATGFDQYVNRDAKIAVIILDGFDVIWDGGTHNAGNSYIAPTQAIHALVSRSGNTPAVFRVQSNTDCSLMSNDLGAYVTGKIYGVIWYPTN